MRLVSGCQLDFFRDRPQFLNATGWVEVLNNNTLLIKLESQPVESVADEDDLMLSLFLYLIACEWT